MATIAKQDTRTAPKGDWLLVAGLLALALVPALGGIARLGQVSGGVVSPENARFLAAPAPIVLHILGTTLYSFLGAFQFSASFRRCNPTWHRSVGKVLVLAGLIVALSGLWMTLVYPITKVESGPAGFDGVGVYLTRLLVGVAMAWFIVLGLAAIRKRDIPSHRAWMMRSYALGMGAGTQVFTHLPWFLFPSLHGELARTLCMAAGWAINLAVAEWFIVKKRSLDLQTCYSCL